MKRLQKEVPVQSHLFNSFVALATESNFNEIISDKDEIPSQGDYTAALIK